MRACGVAVWSIRLWNALAWPFTKTQQGIVADQTGRLEVGLAMSALGQKQTFRNVQLMSALPPKADIGAHNYEYTP
jgi:hypothetical protein